ncbi:hypothetical protein E2C01_027410 [Portunus trituberculatus]|uniref:Uncharacterized protein n=1 Tax=Portunus trituberculatus TaxID=210409 RepID=A0A5B7EL97_PORTR|nr:hypothetical protein [Portunus trituberculatus]
MENGCSCSRGRETPDRSSPDPAGHTSCKEENYTPTRPKHDALTKAWALRRRREVARKTGTARGNGGEREGERECSRRGAGGEGEEALSKVMWWISRRGQDVDDVADTAALPSLPPPPLPCLPGNKPPHSSSAAPRAPRYLPLSYDAKTRPGAKLWSLNWTL